MTPADAISQCPLCAATDGRLYAEDRLRSYYECPVCRLVYVPPGLYPTAAEEKDRYDLHRNTRDDKGYVSFLNRLVSPLKKKLSPNASGLDFGSGPVPVLAELLEEVGLTVASYDIFYDNRPEVLEQQYDFITLSEVIEHLHFPYKTLETLFNALHPGGLLAVMTQPRVSAEAFAGWWYKNDPTHVLFFSDATFEWIGTEFNGESGRSAKDVWFIRKNES